MLELHIQKKRWKILLENNVVLDFIKKKNSIPNIESNGLFLFGFEGTYQLIVQLHKILMHSNLFIIFSIY